MLPCGHASGADKLYDSSRSASLRRQQDAACLIVCRFIVRVREDQREPFLLILVKATMRKVFISRCFFYELCMDTLMC